jgi:hypothetical protein
VIFCWGRSFKIQREIKREVLTRTMSLEFQVILKSYLLDEDSLQALFWVI